MHFSFLPRVLEVGSTIFIGTFICNEDGIYAKLMKVRDNLRISINNLSPLISQHLWWQEGHYNTYEKMERFITENSYLQALTLRKSCDEMVWDVVASGFG